MQGNDLSNGTPKTVMINLDLVTKVDKYEVRKWGRKKMEEVRQGDLLKLNALYRVSFEIDATLELFSTDSTVEKWHEEFDHRNVNPFRWATHYDTYQKLVSELPFRSTLAGVCDVPERALMYGSYYMDYNRLFSR